MKIKSIDISGYPKGERTDFYLPLYEDSLGNAVDAPFIVARGASDGPILGLSAAVHGNELNGIVIIQKLLAEVDLQQLKGTLVCAPIVNVPAYNAGSRYFLDGADLNHAFGGRAGGTPSQQYANSFRKSFLPACEYLIDIHTASEGRLNSFYVRVDPENEVASDMALWVNPEIVLQIRGGDGTLRGAARKMKIPAITVEAGNPSVIQGKMVFEGELGVKNIMSKLRMLKGEIETTPREPVICSSSKWLRTTGGGLLDCHLSLRSRLASKQLIATTRNAFGHVNHEYFAPNNGIVIGMAANPVAVPGTRFCHLGVVAT